jgi:DNA-binding CsgD family transcriptional regulator
VSQSTMVDSPGPSRRSASSDHGSVPADADYHRIYAVLERCDSAGSLSDFKEQLVSALSSVFGFRDLSFFAGPTFQTTFNDPVPIVSGRTATMLTEYHDRWAQYDIFGTPPAVRLLQAGGVASLGEVRTYGGLPIPASAYVRHFLDKTWSIEAAAAMRIDLYGMHTGLIGIFTTDAAQLGPVELATLRLLARRLSAVARNIPYVSARGGLRGLTARQHEVVGLVAQGLSNAQIASTLSLAEDSVKKYVSRVLAVTGCHSRMDLALLARAS